MRKILMMLAIGLPAAGVHAQSLALRNANYPGIYCRFSANCAVSPTEKYDSFLFTNLAANCVLESRSFPGTSMDSNGKYGYEYCLTLNTTGGSTAGTNIVTVKSLTLAFGAPGYFAFGLRASNQVWVVTDGGPAGLAPASAELSDTNVIVHFDPPLTLNLRTDQTTNTYNFGLISGSAPEITDAILAGTTQDPVYGTKDFTAKVRAQTP